MYLKIKLILMFYKVKFRKINFKVWYKKMDLAIILFKQIGVMWILIFIGFFLVRLQKLPENASEIIIPIILYCVMPIAVFNSFPKEYNSETAKNILLATVLSLILLILSMIISGFLFKKYPIDNFGGCFSNASFLGMPLVEATLGKNSLVYVVPFIGFLTLFQWIYGDYIFSKNSKLDIKSILKNPVLIALVLGFIRYYLRISLPYILDESLRYISALNAPLAMILLGTYISRTKLISIFKEKKIYITTLVRLIIVPIVTMLVLSLLPTSINQLKLALLIVASAPVGSNVALYSQRHNQDYIYSVKLVCLSTLISMITLPIIIYISVKLWI